MTVCASLYRKLARVMQGSYINFDVKNLMQGLLLLTVGLLREEKRIYIPFCLFSGLFLLLTLLLV